MMVPTREMTDALYLDRLRKAQRMPFAEKFLAGEELFEMACAWSRIGIRADHPEATEAEVLDYLKQRIRMSERLEQMRSERNCEA